MDRKRWSTVVVLAAAAVAMLVTVALAFAAEPELQVGSVGGFAMVVVGDEAPVVLKLADFRDGETRTIRAGDRDVTVVRTGETYELSMKGTDGKERKIVITRSRADHPFVFTTAHGDSQHVVVRKVEKVTVKGADDGQEPETVWVQADGGTTALSGHQQVFVVRGDGDGGEEEVTVMAGPPAHGLSWVGGDKDFLVFRCPDDGTVVMAPKDKVPGGTLLCPVCGKTMERSDSKALHVTVEGAKE